VSGRRLIVLLLVLAAVAAPAGVLRALCLGNACDDSSSASPRVPFCSLPADLRQQIANGFREGRSPDVLAVARGTPLFTDVAGLRVPWPTTAASAADTRVPLVFAGPRVEAGAAIPDGVTLDRVAPTVADLISLDRPFPDVRSGTLIDGVAGPPDAHTPAQPRLVLLVAWKGVGSAELEGSPDEWPFLASLKADGAGTLAAQPGSLPLDPTAVMTTIGTGGLPSQHGITGTLVRNDEGRVTEAFGSHAPVHVIATLADDLRETEPRTLVGLVGTEASDRGLVGGGWYPDQGPVDEIIGDAAAAPLAVQAHLATGYGADAATDVLGVAIQGRIASLDRWTRRIVASARAATHGSVVVVVVGTGAWEARMLAVPSSDVASGVEDVVPGDRPVIAETVPGGMFLDQDVLTAQAITGQVVVDELLAAETPEGESMFADAFQGFAVSFARYC